MATSRFALPLAAAMALVSAAGFAETPVEAGAALQTLSGAPYDFGAVVRQSRAVVLVFWSAGCPCVRRYQQRVEGLISKYGPSGVKVLGVSSNAGEDPASVQRAVTERGITLEVVRDPSGKLAEVVGARSTPTVAVLGRDGKVAYLGWIDNEREPGVEGREPYLERALDALLAGKGGFSRRSPVYGCRITRKLFEVGQCHTPPSNP